MSLEALADPKIIVSFVSIVVGAFIALRTYRVTKKRKDFDTANQIRTMLQESLNLEKEIANEVSTIAIELSQKTSYQGFVNIEKTPILLDTIDKQGLNQTTEPELKELIKKAYNVHNHSIMSRNLYAYSLRDLVAENHRVLGNFEKTVVYGRIINSERDGENWEKWYNRIADFYKQLRSQRDYSNQMRLAFDLIKAEIRYGKLESASARLNEISQSDFARKSGITRVIIKSHVERLRRMLESQEPQSDNNSAPQEEPC